MKVLDINQFKKPKTFGQEKIQAVVEHDLRQKECWIMS